MVGLTLTGVLWTLPVVLASPLLYPLVVFVAAVVIGVEVTLQLRPGRSSPLPIFAGIWAVLTTPFLMSFTLIATAMWRRVATPGFVPPGAQLSLAGAHAVFIILCVVLAVILVRRLSAKALQVGRTSGFASLVFLICTGVAFFGTIPRAGDEGLLMWIFIVPAFLLVALILLVVSLIAFIRLSFRPATTRECSEAEVATEGDRE